MRQALKTAERMDYAMGVEKRSVAQMETLIDYSDNGIIQIDGYGNIVSENVMMEGLIQKKTEEIRGSLCVIFFRKSAGNLCNGFWKREGIIPFSLSGIIRYCLL